MPREASGVKIRPASLYVRNPSSCRSRSITQRAVLLAPALGLERCCITKITTTSTKWLPRTCQVWYNESMRRNKNNSQTAKLLRSTKKEVVKMFELEISEADTSTSETSSKYDSLFTTEEREVLALFRTYLVEGCGFQKTSASSYRANFMRARSKSLAGEALNSDERSARKKFDEFMKQLGVDANGIVEDPEEPSDEQLSEEFLVDIEELEELTEEG